MKCTRSAACQMSGVISTWCEHNSVCCQCGYSDRARNQSVWMSERLIMPQLSEFDKGRCVGYLEAGKSIRWTALTLNVSKSTIERWWNRYRIEGHVRRREGSGRPRLTSPAQDRKLVVKIKRNKFSPVSRLSRECERACSISISVRTATRRAVMAGLHARRPA